VQLLQSKWYKTGHKKEVKNHSAFYYFTCEAEYHDSSHILLVTENNADTMKEVTLKGHDYENERLSETNLEAAAILVKKWLPDM
jgi:hypothetical protein